MDADAEARYREFVEAELGPLLRTAYLLCGSWHTGEDLVQTTFVALYRAWPRLASWDDPRAYARRALTNTFLSARRRRSAREQLFAQLPDPRRNGSTGPDESDAVDERERQRDLLRRLPMRHPSAPRPSAPRPSAPGPSAPGPSVRRQLIDGSTGLALLVLDESAVARVTYAPAGYRPGGACRPPSAVGGSRPTVPESTTVLAPARPGGRLSPVSVTQIFGSRPTQRAGPVWGPPTLLQVHRLPAQLRLGHLAGAHAGQPQYTRVLLWTEHGVNVTVSSGPAASPDRLPSAAELLRVADGVRW